LHGRFGGNKKKNNKASIKQNYDFDDSDDDEERQKLGPGPGQYL
jgi:hypothetical protein